MISVFVCLHIPKTARSSFTEISVHFTCVAMAQFSLVTTHYDMYCGLCDIGEGNLLARDKT